ncbi:MAG: 1-deoxy-D-xylulose-5-phosphate reductoisomerase [Phycisphaerales bacterium]
MAGTTTKRVLILGSTGSIGTQAIDVIRHANALAGRGGSGVRFEIVGLAARSRAGALLEQAAALGVRDVAIADRDAAAGLGSPHAQLELRVGDVAAERLVREVECDIVLAAMVGIAGLPATLAAIELGRDVALANKETLVAAGELVVPAAIRSGSRLLPVDSEHSGVWQCLGGSDGATQRGSDGGKREAARQRDSETGKGGQVPPMRCAPHVAKVVLTASGGPFRSWDRARMLAATPDEALRHPTWSMGPKVTIDSASLMNKGLELLEAHWLFGLEPERLGVLVHPQSIVHALVEHVDGSVVAQLGAPDMRTPIAVALAWPRRVGTPSPRLDWTTLRSLEFQPLDGEKFPAVGLAMRAMREGGTAGAVLNGANEEAVLAFLRGRESPERALPFGRISELVGEAMDRVGTSAVRTLADVLEADAEARRCVRRSLGQANS